MGAVRTTQRQKFVDPRYHKYSRFKKLIRLIANQYDIPKQLDSEDMAEVSLIVSWKRRQRADLDNIVKSVLDALWANDRRVLRLSASAVENTGKDESVTIAVEVVKHGQKREK